MGSQAIARWCAIKTGIYNTADAMACWRDDMVINTMEDFATSMPKNEAGRPILFLIMGEAAMDQATLDKLIEWRTKAMTKLGEILGDGPFFGGAKPSLADFWAFGNIGVSNLERNTKGKEH